MRPFRFVFRCARATWAFLAISARTLAESRPERIDFELSHRYASRLSESWTKAFHLRHEIRNRERLLQNQPCVYLANHRSNLDLIVMSELFPPSSIVIGKREVTRVPFFGKIFVRGGNVAIDRKDPVAARAGMEIAEKRIRDDGLSVFIFPEGTRNYGTMRPFKKGAFHLARNTGIPIVPTVCAVSPGWFDASRLHLDDEVRVVIEVLDAIDSTADEPIDSLIERTRTRMLHALEALEKEVRSG
ncbi:MAG TPA: lysophospholipid acyltransferase family protein [Thermoanaerobaculia bacterium]|nr:lysophospholipid acyltransferase family protein [Thermoanaerobaculia bacterium]